jgi:hypothetical protein
LQDRRIAQHPYAPQKEQDVAQQHAADMKILDDKNAHAIPLTGFSVIDRALFLASLPGIVCQL